MKYSILYLVGVISAMLFVSCSNSPSVSVSGDSNVLVVDVRTPEEWNSDGHNDCSVNYPIQDIDAYVDDMRGYDKIVVVCRSGGRAGQVKEMLEAQGFDNVENAGAWSNVKCE